MKLAIQQIVSVLDEQGNLAVTALRNDGTVFLHYRGWKEWIELPQIPGVKEYERTDVEPTAANVASCGDLRGSLSHKLDLVDIAGKTVYYYMGYEAGLKGVTFKQPGTPTEKNDYEQYLQGYANGNAERIKTKYSMPQPKGEN